MNNEQIKRLCVLLEILCYLIKNKTSLKFKVSDWIFQIPSLYEKTERESVFQFTNIQTSLNYDCNTIEKLLDFLKRENIYNEFIEKLETKREEYILLEL